MPGRSQPLIDTLRASIGGPAGGLRVALLGRGIQLSRSPAMHEHEGARLGLDYSYSLIDFDLLELSDDALPDVMEAAWRLGCHGFNVTHPFKQAVVPLLDGLAPEAAAIGAVNTVTRQEGLRTGHNTDSWGFAQSFREEMAGCSVDHVVQFGAGGAGAAVAHALLELGARELTIIDPDGRRSVALADRLRSLSGGRVTAAPLDAGTLRAATGIVNASPVGMAKYPGRPFPGEWLLPMQWVADVIYFPEDTALLRLAGSLGCRTLAGRGMAVHQAACAFELFTGTTPDVAAMRRHFVAAEPVD